MKLIRITLLTLMVALAFSSLVHAQSDEPLAIIMTADGTIMPPMLEYFQRGIETAEQRDAEVLIIQLNTPGGSMDTMSGNHPSDARQQSAGGGLCFAKGCHCGQRGRIDHDGGSRLCDGAETVIGAASPIDSSGADIQSTLETKIKEILKAKARTLVEERGAKAVKLAEAMIDDAKAVTAKEALDAKLIDFISDDTEDLLQSLNGFTVQMDDGERTLNTENIRTENVDISFIEQLLLMLTDPNIAFLLLAIGVQGILIEISSPGGWFAGFIGAVCLTLAVYGMGVLTVNWFGIIFLLIAFVLFILDIKAPTHGALTTAGVASFIVGALVLFNSPGTPQFQRVSVPLVIGMGIFLGLLFFGILLIALRAQHRSDPDRG